MKTFAIILLSLFLITVSFTQVPQLINYQGKLDSAGVPLSGTRNLTFRIYSVATAGTALWTETQTGVTITVGIFNVLLGSVAPFPGTLFTTTGERYLGITVGTGTEMVPRYRITSTAFSIRAANADNVADNIITSAKIAAGAVGTTQIADNSVTSAKIVDGTIVAADLASNSVTTIKIADNSVTAAKIVDEPGIVHSFTYGAVSLTTADVAVDSVTVNIPTSGYVVVTVHGFFEINHTNGTKDVVRASISTTPNTIDFNNFAVETYDAGLATASEIYRSFSLTKVEAVSAGSRKYYLNADVFSGNGAIRRRHLTAQFFPTAYGTVVSTKQEATSQDPGLSPAGIR